MTANMLRFHSRDVKPEFLGVRLGHRRTSCCVWETLTFANPAVSVQRCPFNFLLASMWVGLLFLHA